MKALKLLLILLLAAAAFAGGYLARNAGLGAGQTRAGQRRVLYWVDAMHPAYKSDKPGIAPDCGMKLEPVYADAAGPAPSTPRERKILYYGDPAQPAYRADKP